MKLSYSELVGSRKKTKYLYPGYLERNSKSAKKR